MVFNGFTIHFKQGGGEKALYNLLKRLNYSKFKIFCFKRTKNISIKDTEIISLKDEGFIKFFSEFVKCKNETIISSLWSSNSFLLTFKLFGLTNISWIREGNEVASAIKDSNLLKGLLWKTSIRYLYRHADTIIVMNDCMKTSLLDLNQNLKNKIKVIPNYIDINQIINLSRQKINSDLSSLEDIEFILTIGRLCNQKNFINLIEAFSIAKKEYKIKAKLVIIGKGELKQKILSKINNLNLNDEIYLYDFIENPYNILKLSKLYIMASFYEGYPNALVEAIILTKNVISSYCNCGPKQFFMGENKERLFNPYDIQDMSLKIKTYLDSKKMNIDPVIEKIEKDNKKALQLC